MCVRAIRQTSDKNTTKNNICNCNPSGGDLDDEVAIESYKILLLYDAIDAVFLLFPRRLTFLIFRADFSNSLTCLMVQGASRAGRPCRVMGHSGVALQFSPGCAVDLMRGKEIL